MNNTAVNLGIIGYGHYIRSSFVRGVAGCASIRIVGVFDKNRERLLLAKGDGFRIFSSLDELLNSKEIDAVVIGTSNAAHKELAVMAARAGKHIFCEKPMALNYKEASEMTEEARLAGVITHVSYTTAYGDDFLLFRELSLKHTGSVRHFWFHHSRGFGLWSQGAFHGAVAHPEVSGGWIFHHTCHGLNMACLIAGSTRAVSVYTITQKSTPEAPSEEYVNALITFDNGVTVSLSDGLSIGRRDDMGVQGTKGDLRMVGDVITLDQPGPEEPGLRPGSRSHLIKKFPVKATGKNLARVSELFAQAVHGGKNELLSFSFVRDQYRILDAMRESARTGKVITP